jgi:protein ImuA
MSTLHPLDRSALLAALRARAAHGAAAPAGPLRLGAEIDAELPGGGLARGALHEMLVADGDSAALGFVAVLLGKAGGSAVWIAADRDAMPSAPARFGLDPARLVLVRAAGADAAWAMEEALRSAAAAAVLVLPRAPDAATERRLSLAARTGGGLALLLCAGEDGAPGQAPTRWRLSAASGGTSRQALADPRWRLAWLGRRGGHPCSWTIAWSAASGTLRVEEPDCLPERPALRRRREAARADIRDAARADIGDAARADIGDAA